MTGLLDRSASARALTVPLITFGLFIRQPHDSCSREFTHDEIAALGAALEARDIAHLEPVFPEQHVRNTSIHALTHRPSQRGDALLLLNSRLVFTA